MKTADNLKITLSSLLDPAIAPKKEEPKDWVSLQFSKERKSDAEQDSISALNSNSASSVKNAYVLAEEAIQYVKNRMTYGAYNKTGKVHEKLRQLIKPYWDWGYDSDYQGGSLELLCLLELIRKNATDIILPEDEKDQLPALLAVYTGLTFVGPQNVTGSCNSMADLAKSVYVSELLRAGNCAAQAAVALAFLLKTYPEQAALYPLRLYTVEINYDPERDEYEDGHTVLLIGESEVVCDPWDGKCFLFEDWESKINPKYRYYDKDEVAHKPGEGYYPSYEAVQPQLPLLYNPKVKIDLNAEDIDQWVKAFYEAITKEELGVQKKMPSLLNGI